MKNRKGFIFIETIVVIAILTFSLIMVYASYNSSIIKEKKRLYYNDIAYLYRTYFISEFLRNPDYENLKALLGDKNIVEFGCGNVFAEGSNESIFCSDLVSENMNVMDIAKFYFAKKDMSYVWNCSTASECEMDQELFKFTRTIGEKGKEGYRIIIKYRDKPRNNTTVYNYATLVVEEPEDET